MDLNTLTSEVSTLGAISISVERILEIFKQIFGGVPLIRLLFIPQKTKCLENLRCGILHIVSGGIGALIAVLGHVRIPGINSGLSYLLIGLLSSAGSAFWNHSLDILQALKIRQEQAALASIPAQSPERIIAGMPSEN